MEGIALDLREPHPGILEEAHSVRRRDHRLAGTPDRYGLAAPGISRVLVWLDNPSRDDEVRLLDELLRGARHVVGRNRPKVGPHRGIASVGVDDAHAVDDRAELVALLGVCRRAMQSDRHDDGDLRVGDAPCVQLAEERRDQHRVRRRACEVGHRDHRSRIRSFPDCVRREVPEAFASERRLKTAYGFRREVDDGCCRGRLDDVEVEPGLQHELELLLTVRNAVVRRATRRGVAH